MIDMLLRGVPTTKLVEGVAAAASVDLQPAAGEQWVVAAAWGVHDDAAAVVLQWGTHDGLSGEQQQLGISVAAGLPVPLYAVSPLTASNNGSEWKLPIVLNEKFHLTLNGAVAAGKKLYIKAVVYVYSGVGPWGEPR